MFLLLKSTTIFAQYSLSEFGVKAGAGYQSVIPSDDFKGAIFGSAGIYFSYYFCGQIYGFQTELNARGMFSDFTSSDLNAAVLFKIRAKNYHKKNETALLTGASANFNVYNNLESEIQSVQAFELAWQLSIWRKQTFGDLVFYFQPGIEYGITPKFVVSGNNNGVNSLYAFFNLGLTYWNNR